MAKYYTSGEFVEKAHVSIRTFRYYDQKNLLKPVARVKGAAVRKANVGGTQNLLIQLKSYSLIKLGCICETHPSFCTFEKVR